MGLIDYRPPAVLCCMMAKGVEVLIRCQPDEIEYVLLRAIAFANDSESITNIPR